MQPGKVGNCINFDGDGDFFDAGDNIDMDTSDFTITFWFTTPPKDNYQRCPVGKRFLDGVHGIGYSIHLRGHISPEDLYFGVKDSDYDYLDTVCEKNSGIFDDNWHFYFGKREADSLYLKIDDGAICNDSNSSVDMDSLDNNGHFYIGQFIPEHHCYYEGNLDEIRLSKGIARSDAWLSTTFKNQNNSNLFISIHEEEQLADVYVDDDADPSWYDATHVRTIQEGIDNATAGNTVFVYSGTYYENVDITKDGINLIGEDKNTTIIDGSNDYGNDIRILNCDYVNISDFTIRNAQVDDGFPFPYFTGTGVCIWAWVYTGGDETASHNTISNCIIYNNARDGVLIAASDTGQSTDCNIVSDCEIYNNGYNLENPGFGICIFPDRDGVTGWAYTRHNQIMNCVLNNNAIGGIRIGREGEASNNIVSECEIFDNLQYGIYLIGHDGGSVQAITSNNYIHENNIYGNHLYGICIETRDGANCGNNYVYHNDFMNTTNNAYDEHSNTWDNGYPSGGNYWSDYAGNDNYHGVNQDIPGSDGIGDTPYPISGGSNQDLYPLMEPYTGFYYDDFEDGTLDKWNVISGDWEVLTEPSGNHIAHLNIASEEGRRMVSKETIDDNVIITAEIKGDSNDIDQSADKMVGFYSNSACTNFYYVSVEYPISIGYWNGVSPITLSINWSIFTNNEIWYNVEIKLENNNIFAKTWEIGAEEPNHWQVSYYGATGFGNHLVIGTNGGIQDEEFWFDDIFIRNLSILPPPDTVYVDDDFTSSTPGWQYDHFDVIQDGIDAVAENGTVYVYNGIYYENIIVDKSINLTGEDKDNTIIDGGGVDDVVYVSAKLVNISGFTIQNSGNGYQYSGIESVSDFNTIIGNVITMNNGHGIDLKSSSSNNNIIGNIIGLNNEYCINLISSNNNNIENNIFNNNNGEYTVSLDDSSENYISNNRFYDNGKSGASFDILIWKSNYNVISNNIISNGSGGGIGICRVNIEPSSNNTICGNTIKNTATYGIETLADYNVFYHNYFINNTMGNAWASGNNTWDNGYPSGGNYWDDYTGTDADGDGIGDTPYDIPGGSNQDLYPLGYFQNIPPTANFTYNPSSPTDLDIIQFTDASTDSDGVIVNWTWDFDDGNISYLQNPTHQYADDGTYLVNLTVMDNDYEYDSLNRLITVTNVPPVADANGPYTGYVYQLIQFDGSGSYDLDGAIVSYDWNFGDGHTGTGVNPTHTYTSTGTFIVTLTVEDNDGDTDTNYSVAVIYTHHYPPVADADGPYEGIVGEPIQFYGSATGGSKPYSWYWTFGDGQSSNLQNPTHTYDETGVHTVVLKVTDNNDESDSDTTTATIHPEGTLIADAGGPYSCYVNETVHFYGSALGGEPPYSWYWKFDDGSTSTLQNPTRTYSAMGEYTVILTITDDFGQTDNDMAMVTINSHPPNKPEITGPNSGKAGEEYDYTFSSVDPDGDAVQFYIEWGDGNSEWTGFNSSGDSFTRSHIWDEKDTYIIRAKAKDSNGAESDWATLEVSMPKNKAINPFLLFLERLIERFPILEQILQPIYDKLVNL